MSLRVARIPYLEHEPFYFDMERRGVQLRDASVSTLRSDLVRGELDAAPVPLVDYFKLREGFLPVAGFCVAVLERAGNSILYSKQPIQELSGAAIGASEEATTSRDLLRVLLTLKYRVSPGPFVGVGDSPAAMLLTGDQALRRRRALRGYSHRYDLGEEWHSWTGLPFVFSRWVMRQDLAPEEALLLEDTLYVGLEDGVDGLYHISEPRENVLMLPRDVMEYIQGVRYFVGFSEQKAIDLFRRYLDQVGTAS